MKETRAEKLINELLSLHPKGFDLSLTRISALLERLGNPQDRLPRVIHIAGTNGKGSTSAFCRAILEEAGYSVHVHTSPHLVNWHERYRIGQKGGGRLVDDELFADAITRVANANNGQKITVFEILSAVAFVLFSEQPADAVIMEVGLGGRFDATNVIKNPAVSVITPVSLDHVAFLGDTIEKIAFEKAGIIKEKSPVVIGQQRDDSAIDVLCQKADSLKAPVSIYGQDFSGYIEHARMVFQNEDGLMDLPLPHLIGQHQISNAATSIEAILKAGFNVTETDIANAMRHVTWPARMQHLTTGRLIEKLPQSMDVWLDGGHNPDASMMIASTLRDLNQRDPKPLILLCGMINTKDASGYFANFNALAKAVYTVPIQSSDAGVLPQELAQMAEKAGLKAAAFDTIDQALQQIAQDTPDARLLISGSLYLAGDILKTNETPPE